MGTREWERGSFTLPASEWVKFRKALVTGYGQAQASDIATIQRLHDAVKAAVKGKRAVELEQAVRQALGSRKPAVGLWEGELEHPLLVVDEYKAICAILKKDEATGKFKLQRPKKQFFEAPKQTTTVFYACTEATITLDPAERKVTWDVPETKGACNWARASHMGKLLFALLAKVKWLRGSGGSVHGGDEHRQEAGREHAGAGGSYLKDRFGPLGDQDYERLHGMKPPPRPAYYGYNR